MSFVGGNVAVGVFIAVIACAALPVSASPSCCRSVTAAQSQTHAYTKSSTGFVSDISNAIAVASCDACGALCDTNSSCASYLCADVSGQYQCSVNPTAAMLSAAADPYVTVGDGSYGQYCVGTSLGVTTAENAAGCQALCDTMSGCLSYTFILSGCASNYCDLFSTCGTVGQTGCTQSTTPGYISKMRAEVSSICVKGIMSSCIVLCLRTCLRQIIMSCRCRWLWTGHRWHSIRASLATGC